MRRISAVSNAIETIDNEMICFIIYCLNCIRHGRNATYERGLTDAVVRIIIDYKMNLYFSQESRDALSHLVRLSLPNYMATGYETQR